ncbi:MAG: response regulator transcription factor [Campylobacteraceae bacterium]|nr:response regulator transcription factor [Campylobacteraceae bacterium]
MKIIIYSDDMLVMSYLIKNINVEYTCIDNIDELFNFSNSIIILHYSIFSPNIEELLIASKKNKKNKILILNRTPNFVIGKRFLAIGAKGYGNALMHAHFIVSAINTLNEGMIWLHPEFISMLISDIPKSNSDNEDLLEILTEREKEVASLLKNGKRYKEIAKELFITPRTVKSHAQNIYIKLNVKDKINLSLLLR